MLVLSRKQNERIVIGEQVVVTVVGLGGGKVRLGIEAPGHVAVHRAEVFDRIRREANSPTALPGDNHAAMVDVA